MADGRVSIKTNLDITDLKNQVKEAKEALKELGKFKVDAIKIDASVDLANVEDTLKNIEKHFYDLMWIIRSGLVNAFDGAKDSMHQMGETLTRTLVPASRTVAEHMESIETEGVVEITKTAKQAESSIKRLTDNIAELTFLIDNIGEMDLSADDEERKLESYNKRLEETKLKLARMQQMLEAINEMEANGEVIDITALENAELAVESTKAKIAEFTDELSRAKEAKMPVEQIEQMESALRDGVTVADELNSKFAELQQKVSEEITTEQVISEETTQQLNALVEQANKATTEFGELQRKTAEVTESTEKFGQASDKSATGIKRQTQALKESNAEKKKAGELSFRMFYAMKFVTAGVNRFGKSVRQAFGNAVRATGNMLKNLIGVNRSMRETTRQTNRANSAFGKLNARLIGLAVTAMVFNQIRRKLREFVKYANQAMMATTEFSHAMAVLKGSALTAFQPFFEVIMPILIQFIQLLSIAIQRIALLVAMFFKLDPNRMKANAKATYELANGIGAAGAAAKEANRHLAKFDELQKLPSVSETGGAGADLLMPDFDWEFPDLPQWLLDLIDWLKPLFEQLKNTWQALIDSLKRAWERHGAEIIAIWKRAMTEVRDLIIDVLRDFEKLFKSATWDLFLDEIARSIKLIGELVYSVARAFRLAWNENERGYKMLLAMTRAATQLLGLANDILESFIKAWNNGERGKQIFALILEIVTNIANTIENLATQIRKAWNEDSLGVKIWEKFLDIIIRLLGFIERITKATSEWAKTVNFTPLLESVNLLLGAFENLAGVILDSLGDAWENTVLPFFTFLLEMAIPKAIEWVAEQLERLAIWIKENDIDMGRFILNLMTAISLFGVFFGVIAPVVMKMALLAYALSLMGGNMIGVLASAGKLVLVFGLIAAVVGIALFASDDLGETLKELALIIGSVVAAITIFKTALAIYTIIGKLKMAIVALNAASTAMAAGQLAAGGAMVAFKAKLVAISIAMKGATGVVAILKGAFIALALPFLKVIAIIALIAAAIYGIIKLIQNWSTVVEWFKNLWETVWTAVKNAFSAVVDWFKDNWQSLLLFMVNPVAGIFKYFYDNFEGFRDLVDNVIQSVLGYFENLWTNIKELPSKVFEALKELPSKISYALGAALAFIINFIIDSIKWFSELPLKIWDLIVSVHNIFVGWGIQLGTWAMETIPKFVMSVIKFIGELPSKIWEKITEAYNKVVEWGVSLITWAIETIPQFIENIITFIAELPSKIWETLVLAWQKFVDWGTDVLTFLGELPAKLWQLGADIVNGLLEGIKTTFGNIGGWINDNIFSPFMDGFNKVFKRSSPSKVMVEAGSDVIEGFAIGLSKEERMSLEVIKNIKDLILETVRDLATQMVIEGQFVMQSFADGILEFSEIPNEAFKVMYDEIILITNEFVTVLTEINTLYFTDTIKSTTDFFKTIFDMTKKLYADTVTETTNLIKTLMDMNSQFIDETTKEFKKFFTDMETMLRKFYEEQLKQTNQMIADMLGVLASARPAFYQAGYNLMESVAQGIEAGVQRAIDAIIEGAEKIKAAFAEHMQISSPSKVFLYFGEMLMAGLGDGIEDNLKLALDPLADMFEKIADQIENAMKRIENAMTRVDPFSNLKIPSMPTSIIPSSTISALAERGRLMGSATTHATATTIASNSTLESKVDTMIGLLHTLIGVTESGHDIKLNELSLMEALPPLLRGGNRLEGRRILPRKT